MKSIPLVPYHDDLLTVIDPSPFFPYLISKCSVEKAIFYYPAVRPFTFSRLAQEVAGEAVAADLDWQPFHDILVEVGSKCDLPTRYVEDVLGFAINAGRDHQAEWVHYARAYVYDRGTSEFVNIVSGDRYRFDVFDDMWDEIHPHDATGSLTKHFRSNKLIVEVDAVMTHHLRQPSVEVGVNGGILRLTQA